MVVQHRLASVPMEGGQVTDGEGHLRAAWGRVTRHDIEMGMRAYPTYNATLRLFSDVYWTPFVQTVEAFAALSPNNDYHGNLRSLASVLYGFRIGVGPEAVTVSTYKSCAVRAFSYLTGEVSFLDTVRGRKITSFRHNLLYPDTSRLVTVDGHMLGVWAGKHLTMKQAVPYLRGGTYDAIERAVQRLSKREGIPCAAVQATLWMQRKRERGVVFSEQTELFSGFSRWDEVCHPKHYPPFGADREYWQAWFPKQSAHPVRIYA